MTIPDGSVYDRMLGNSNIENDKNARYKIRSDSQDTIEGQHSDYIQESVIGPESIQMGPIHEQQEHSSLSSNDSNDPLHNGQNQK